VSSPLSASAELLVVTSLSFVCLMAVKGYQGMVDGGDCIVQAEWKTVSGIIQKVSLHYCLYYGGFSS